MHEIRRCNYNDGRKNKYQVKMMMMMMTTMTNSDRHHEQDLYMLHV